MPRASDWVYAITARDASRRFLSVVTVSLAAIDLFFRTILTMADSEKPTQSAVSKRPHSAVEAENSESTASWILSRPLPRIERDRY